MPLMEKLRKENREHSIEVVGAKLREMMSWLFKKPAAAGKKEEVGV
jgi:ketol-acid reductoisomerase